jgi:hypothetical protein
VASRKHWRREVKALLVLMGETLGLPNAPRIDLRTPGRHRDAAATSLIPAALLAR